MSTVDIWPQFPADIIVRLGELQVAQPLGRTSRWMFFMIASAILLEEVQDVQKRSFRTLAIEIVKKFRPHVLGRLHSRARTFMISHTIFSFLIFWRVDRDARGNAILVRDGPPAPARNALSENGVEFLKVVWDPTLDHTQYSMLFNEGCVAILARDYAWFLSDARIPELEDVTEEDVGSEEDSEEDSEFTTRLRAWIDERTIRANAGIDEESDGDKGKGKGKGKSDGSCGAEVLRCVASSGVSEEGAPTSS